MTEIQLMQSSLDAMHHVKEALTSALELHGFRWVNCDISVSPINRYTTRKMTEIGARAHVCVTSPATGLKGWTRLAIKASVVSEKNFDRGDGEDGEGSWLTRSLTTKAVFFHYEFMSSRSDAIWPRLSKEVCADFDIQSIDGTPTAVQRGEVEIVSEQVLQSG